MGRLMSRPIEEKKNPQQALDETHTTRGLPHRRNTAISVWPLADPLPDWEVLT
jgi:hypothetical protein